MKARKDGSIGGAGSRRNWKPKSSGTSGEVAMAAALQKAHIRYATQVPIRTPFSAYTFLCDFVLLDKPVVIEIQGGLHRRTWGGKPALHRMAKDDAKKNCLEAYGYKVLWITDTQIKRTPDEVVRLVRKELQK